MFPKKRQGKRKDIFSDRNGITLLGAARTARVCFEPDCLCGKFMVILQWEPQLETIDRHLPGCYRLF